MKNKLITIFFIFIALLMVHNVVFATDENNENEIICESSGVYGDFEYNIGGYPESVSINKYNGNKENVVIPNTIEGKPVKYIYDNAFSWNESIKSVVIPDTVIWINYEAFYKCKNLTKVTFPQNLERIDIRAFAYTNLSSIIIPGHRREVVEGVIVGTSISANAFSVCENLKTVILEDGVDYIGSNAFSFCSKLTTISIPDNVREIQPSSFYEANKVEIYGIEGSYAQKYAKENNIKFHTYIEPFVDTKTNAFYENALKYLYSNGYVTGTTKITFSPNDKLSRAMLVTILWNMEGRPKASGTNKFPDVKNGAWYTDAIVWASTSGVVNGNKDGTFTPNNNITRQEVAVMLCNYAKYKGKNVTSSKDLSTFKDNSRVASWALPSMRWAIENKVIGGAENGTKINPVNNATRAEAVTMIKNYIDNVK